MTPLERAARAVRDEIAYPHGDGSFVVEGGFRDDPFFQEVARAVLEAIREPSEAMIRAGEAWQQHCSDVDTLFSEMVKVAIHGPDS